MNDALNVVAALTIAAFLRMTKAMKSWDDHDTLKMKKTLHPNLEYQYLSFRMKKPEDFNKEDT